MSIPLYFLDQFWLVSFFVLLHAAFGFLLCCVQLLVSSMLRDDRFCFFEWDGELVNKSSFGSFVYWFSFLYTHLSKICGILFAVFTLSSLADQLSGRHEVGKKSRR